MADADESGGEVFLSLDDDGPVVPVKKEIIAQPHQEQQEEGEPQDTS